MEFLLTSIITAVVLFAATNIDDIVVLTTFFSQKTKGFHTKHIVFGQYLGFLAILDVSMIGYFANYIIPEAYIGLLGLIPLGIGLKQLIKNLLKRSKEADEEELNLEAKRPTNFFSKLINPRIYTVAAVTFANGGDNFSIYIPVFANSNIPALLIFFCVFLILIAVWCFTGYHIANSPVVAKILDKYGTIIVPFVFIGLGIYILIHSGALSLIGL